MIKSAKFVHQEYQSRHLLVGMQFTTKKKQTHKQLFQDLKNVQNSCKIAVERIRCSVVVQKHAELEVHLSSSSHRAHSKKENVLSRAVRVG